MEFKSGCIQRQAKIAEEMNTISPEKLLERALSTVANDGPLPPVEYMQIIGSHNREHFVGNMRFFASEIVSRCKARPESSFLDIGCGCGRLALPLSQFINDSGKFYGVDVWSEGIDWCTRNISAISDGARFYHLPAEDNYYFAEEKKKQNNFKLHFLENGSIDIAFALSVFTHLKKRDTLSYLKEIGRTLRPDGVAYVTCFIIDHFFWDYVARTGNHHSVKESETDRGCFYAYSHQDYFAGLTMGIWNEMLAESGLWAICHETGQWAQKPGSRLWQDTFILGRRRS